ncbi:MAG: beta-galactosidase [Lachnospiraceae bacterium]|nr:beta-galactosidase [Lachnospiraceae bacterium]
MLEIKDTFYLNGEELQIISASFHYFRTVPEYWRDRLEKLKNMGCNTIETYIPWNFHEEKRGQYRFDGIRDICAFIELVQELDMYMIVRPSPYICSEWEFGGLPAWLLKDRNMRLRCSYEPYLQAVKEYYEVLIPMLVPYQIDRGGNIILVQIENEYGYYGNDKAYLEFLRDTMRELGITVPFVTSDGPWKESGFKAGCVEGALPTGNFGSDAAKQFPAMEQYIGKKVPLMCMEFWNGWFDAWGEGHHTTSAEAAAKELDEILSRGHVNFYMGEGGTSFGFMSGRNAGNTTCDITSYDYDGPLSEDGQMTEKYYACQKVIRKYRDFEEMPLSMEIQRKSYGSLTLKKRVGLFQTLEDIAKPIRSAYPLTMEEIDQSVGYMLYRIQATPEEKVLNIQLEGANDRTQVYQNGVLSFVDGFDNRGCFYESKEPVTAPVIDLLCENMSRENFGTGLDEQRKGISKGVKLNEHYHYGYEIYSLPFDEEQIAKLNFDKDYEEGQPSFSLFELEIDEVADTFLDFTGFGKGCAFVNGFNIGRFWEIGPQKRLYIPAPLLKKGLNQIILFETEGKTSDSVSLCDGGVF